MGMIAGRVRHRWTLATMSPSREQHEITVSVDGRIDDRDDFIHALNLPPDAEDAAIVVAAYQRWGDDFPEHIDGDYAIALWNARTATLILIRDRFGVRPLYYYRTPESLLWCSRLQPLIEETNCDRTPDPHFVGALLTNGGRLDVSPYRAIAAVPPATVVRFTRDSQSQREYWRLDPERMIRLGSDADYEERFYELFESSVRNRLRSTTPVFAELSGGVDSSAIVAVASRHANIQTISHIYNEVPASDDRPFIDKAEQAFGCPSHRFDERDFPLFSGIESDYPYEAPTPFWTSAGLRAQASAVMAQHGSTVLLRGAGGDHICWSEIDIPPSVSDAVSSLRIAGAVAEARRWAPAVSLPIGKILGGATRLALNARFGIGERESGIPPWLNRKFARETEVGTPSQRWPEARLIRRPSRREHYFMIRSLASSIGLRQCVDPAIDVRYPFADRRLVEFAFSIPIEQHLRPGETRSLQRRALARVMPRELAYRRTKGGPALTMYHRLRLCWPVLRPMLERLRVAEHGYADRAPLMDALQRAGHGQNVNAPALLRVLALEFWLRSIERPVAADRSQRQANFPAEGGEHAHGKLREAGSLRARQR